MACLSAMARDALRALAAVPDRIVTRIKAPPRFMAWLDAGRRYVAHTTRRVRNGRRSRRAPDR